MIKSSLTVDEYNTLELEIKESMKVGGFDLNINSNVLLKQINFIFNTNYTLEQVNYVLGSLFEEQFKYKEREVLV